LAASKIEVGDGCRMTRVEWRVARTPVLAYRSPSGFSGRRLSISPRVTTVTCNFSEEEIMAIKSIKHWQDPVNLVLGLWLVASPWVLRFQAEADPTWSAVVLGAVIAAVAAAELMRVMAWEEWLEILLGVAVALSPWILGFSGIAVAMWNAVIVGAVVAVLALWTLATDRTMRGWSHA
jgi:hypothetical protein